MMKVAKAICILICYILPEAIIEENMYFIVSPKDIVIARQRDQDDHITWLLEHEMFEVTLLLPFTC